MGTPTTAVFGYLKRAIVMWVGTIFLVAGSVASVGSLGEWRDAQRFERDAVTEQAELVAKSLTSATRDGNSSTRYLVTYRFTAPGGDVLEQTEQIPLEDWEALAEGDTFAVRYLSSDPTTVRMRPPNPAWVPPLVASSTAVFALLGLAIARPGWRRALVLIRVLRHGVAAQATVIEVAPSGMTINRVPQWHLRYEFHDALGRAQRGTSDYLRPHEAAQWRLGDHGSIRYDRDRPTESLWLGRG